ncbi:MAG: macro domain-containing protein [Candidatus Daviesbacteria bacterium]|nr:macro domain-containing protein [Candidatus Daviesbacteria bacterium]
MPTITLATGQLTDFKGDSLICGSVTDLTATTNKNAKELLEKAGKGLEAELLAIGYCALGNAVITKGHDIKVKHIIFVPIKDSFDPTYLMNFTLLHQAIRSALTLADIYKVKTLAIPMLNPGFKKCSIVDKIMAKFTDNNRLKPISDDEVLSIIMSVAKDFEKSSISEITVYKFVR